MRNSIKAKSTICLLLLLAFSSVQIAHSRSTSSFIDVSDLTVDVRYPLTELNEELGSNYDRRILQLASVPRTSLDPKSGRQIKVPDVENDHYNCVAKYSGQLPATVPEATNTDLRKPVRKVNFVVTDRLKKMKFNPDSGKYILNVALELTECKKNRSGKCEELNGGIQMSYMCSITLTENRIYNATTFLNGIFENFGYDSDGRYSTPASFSTGSVDHSLAPTGK